MNKGVIIGIAIIVIVGSGLAFSLNIDNTSDNEIAVISDDSEIEDITLSEKSGKNISIELIESVGLKSP